MNVFMSLSLLPLQMDMYWKSKSGSSSDGLYVVIAIAILVMIMVILNIVKGKMKPTALGGKSSASASARNYSSFALHRLTSNLGFDREQVKMLDYVLRSGGVSDPERFLNSPDLIDRHFKRTYRLIERTSSGEEDLNARLAVLFSTRNIIDINSGGAKATSTRQIPDKTAAVLTVSKINYPVQILSARGDTLIVENPKRSAGSLLQFSNGSKANLAFFTKFSKGFSIETSIVGSSETADGPVLHL
ncbi:MAG: hypothetical protein LBI06_08565, partial [Treponema sp.]|nr:hypothetical protein [Treponema sp.]